MGKSNSRVISINKSFDFTKTNQNLMQKKKRVQIEDMKKASSFRLSLRFIGTIILSLILVFLHLGLEIYNVIGIRALLKDHSNLSKDLFALSTSLIVVQVIFILFRWITMIQLT